MDESPRDCRRLHFLRGWSNVYVRSRRVVKIRQALGSALSLPVQTLGALPPYVNGYGETAADPRYTIGRHRRGCPSKLCVRSFSHASGIHASGRETGRDGSTNRSVFPTCTEKLLGGTNAGKWTWPGPQISFRNRPGQFVARTGQAAKRCSDENRPPAEYRTIAGGRRNIARHPAIDDLRVAAGLSAAACRQYVVALHRPSPFRAAASPQPGSRIRIRLLPGEIPEALHAANDEPDDDWKPG